MNHSVLVPSNNGNGGQGNHDQTRIIQLTTTTRHKESTPINKNLTLAAVSIQWK